MNAEQHAKVLEALEMCQKKGARWHPCDPTAIALSEALSIMRADGVGWQPIETAPLDGSRVMLTVAGYKGHSDPWCRPDDRQNIVHMARFNGEEWWPFIPNNWTHWRPLPAPPIEPTEVKP